MSNVKSWSPYQSTIFDFAENGTGNAVVNAVAGSGKSTTIVEAMNRVSGSAIFLAFNKSIAEELKKRNVNAKTFHSLCYSPVMRYKATNNVEMNKLRTLTKRNMTKDDDFVYGNFCARLVSLARQNGVGCIVANTENVWNEIIAHHDLELDNDNASESRAVELSRQLLEWSNESTMVDFDDMLYFSVKFGISLPKFDFIFVDEAQDTNAIQRAILRKIMHPHTRIIAVGDPAQAIYGFRGADSDSLGLIAYEFNCIQLPLTVSYRCATSIVAMAHHYVEHFRSRPWRP